MRIIRLILLSAATMIVLLHSMIAHSHHAEISENQHIEQHQKADTLFDFILLGFHVDHGDGHLEDMTPGDSLDISQDDFISCFALIATHFHLVEFDVNQEYDIEKDWSLPNSIHSGPDQLRGPPTLS